MLGEVVAGAGSAGELREADQPAARDVAVRRQVVARHDREVAGPGAAARLQCRSEGAPAPCAARRRGRTSALEVAAEPRHVGGDGRVARSGSPVGVERVAGLGDRECDERRRRRGRACRSRRSTLAPSTASEMLSTTRMSSSLRRADQQRVETVLRLQLVGRGRAAAGEGGDSPLVRVVGARRCTRPGARGGRRRGRGGRSARGPDPRGGPVRRRAPGGQVGDAVASSQLEHLSRRCRRRGRRRCARRGRAATRPSRTSRARKAESSRRAMS